jgi:hypothetical protein
MKFLCLAYGDEDGRNALNADEKQAVLAQDVMIRNRGDLMAAVHTRVTAVRNWDGKLEVTSTPYAQHPLPLAGFSVIEAGSLDEVIELVANTPCARARGVIEIRQFVTFTEERHDRSFHQLPADRRRGLGRPSERSPLTAVR